MKPNTGHERATLTLTTLKHSDIALLVPNAGADELSLKGRPPAAPFL